MEFPGELALRFRFSYVWCDLLPREFAYSPSQEFLFLAETKIQCQWFSRGETDVSSSLLKLDERRRKAAANSTRDDKWCLGVSYVIDRVQEAIVAHDARIVEFIKSRELVAAYEEINRIASGVGQQFQVEVVVNFRNISQLQDFNPNSIRDVSIFVDRNRKRFIIMSQNEIRKKLLEIFPNARITMLGFGHEGLHADIDAGRITILPSAVHIWCKVDDKVRNLLDWLFANAYGIKDKTG